MNFSTIFIFTLSLLIQITSCEYKAVCKTEYSFVLKNFNEVAGHFQANLDKVETCLQSLIDRKGCLIRAKIRYPYRQYLSNCDNRLFYDYNSPLSHLKVNDLHQKACSELNKHAEREKYAKDIELREYNILVDPEAIKELLSNLKIGIKVKTDKSAVLNTIKNSAILMRIHFEGIKYCLGTSNAVNQDEFIKCINNTVHQMLPRDLNSLPQSVNELGGPKVIDNIDLKILLNKCLAAKIIIPTNSSDDKQDLIFDEYDSSLDYSVIDELKKKCIRWYWIKVICGILGVSASVILITIYLRRKPATDDEEENGEYHAK